MFNFSKIISEFKVNKFLRENKIKTNNFRKISIFYVLQYKKCGKIYSIQLFLLPLQPVIGNAYCLQQGINNDCNKGFKEGGNHQKDMRLLVATR